MGLKQAANIVRITYWFILAYAYAQEQPVCLKIFRLELLNRFEGLAFDEDASPEDKWRDPKDAASDASQAGLGRTRRRRRA